MHSSPSTWARPRPPTCGMPRSAPSARGGSGHSARTSRGSTPISPSHPRPRAASARCARSPVFLDDLADALDPVDGYSGAEDTLEPLDATGDADVQGRANTAAAPVGLALGGGSTRGLDESFIGVGCDNGIQRG